MVVERVRIEHVLGAVVWLVLRLGWGCWGEINPRVDCRTGPEMGRTKPLTIWRANMVSLKGLRVRQVLLG